MKSLQFFRPTLATTLAFVFAWLLSVRPAQAGYTVTLQQVGPNVIATGSGAIDRTGLTFSGSFSRNPQIQPCFCQAEGSEWIFTGRTSSSVDRLLPLRGPRGFGSGPFTSASSGSGDMVGITTTIFGTFLFVPTGYVSGTALSDSATYNNATLATLGVTPGTYVWTWGAGANQNFTLKILSAAQPTPIHRAAVADFNGDGHPDWVVRNAGTRQTGIWYLNNNVFISGAYGPTLAAGWPLAGVAGFNRDTHPDYALFNPVTDRTAIWYLSGPTFIGSAYGPTLPSGWELAAAADFNGDNKPDYVLYNSGTHRTAIWYLNNSVFVSAAWGPTLPAGWSLVGAADFDRDGHTDYLLFNSITRQTAIWYLSGPTLLIGAWGPTLPSGWILVAAADFNGDSQPDYLLYNVNTQQTAIWYLNNNVFVSGAYGPTLPPGWSFFGP